MDKIRVLLVEDEPTLAMIIKDTLDGEEFEVILAANGEEGLSRYREAKPDKSRSAWRNLLSVSRHY